MRAVDEGKENYHGQRKRRGSHNQGGLQIPEDFTTHLSQTGPYESDPGEKGWTGLESVDVGNASVHGAKRGVDPHPLGSLNEMKSTRTDHGLLSLRASSNQPFGSHFSQNHHILERKISIDGPIKEHLDRRRKLVISPPQNEGDRHAGKNAQ